MRVTAVYASVDAEGVDDLDKEAAMSGYKCVSCGDGTVALSAAGDGEDYRFCIHCGGSAELVRDVSSLNIAQRLLTASEDSLVAVKCPKCMHKSISERSSLHRNHASDDGDEINVHCTECGTAMSVAAEAVPLGGGSGDAVGDGDELDAEIEASVGDVDDDLEDEESAGGDDDEFEDDGDDEEYDDEDEEESADAAEVAEGDGDADEDDGEEQGDEDEGDDEYDDEYEEIESRADEDDDVGDDEEDEFEDDGEEAGANKNRDRRQALKDALEEDMDDPDDVDDGADGDALAEEESASEEEAMGGDAHYIRMGDNSAEIGFMGADDKTLARVHRVMARFPRLKVTRKPKVMAGKILLGVKGRKAKACMDAMRREFGNIFDYAAADGIELAGDISIEMPRKVPLMASKIMRYDNLMGHLLNINRGKLADGHGVFVPANPKMWKRGSAEKVMGRYEGYRDLELVIDDHYAGERASADGGETAAPIKNWDDLERYGPDLIHRGLKLLRSAARSIERFASDGDPDSLALIAVDMHPMIEALSQSGVMNFKVPARLLKELRNAARLQEESSAKAPADVDETAEATASADVPAIALVDEEQDVTFASDGSQLFCMAGTTCIAKLDYTGDVGEMSAAVAAMAEKSSLREALEDAKFDMVSARVMREGEAASADAERLAEEASAKLDEEVSGLGEVAAQAIGISTMGVNRGFFDADNPLAEKLASELAAAGMDADDAEALVAEAFDEAADEYASVVSDKAVEIMRKPEDVRNELASTIASVRHRSPAPRRREDAAGGDVRSRLSHAMKPSASTAPVEEASGGGSSKVAAWAAESKLGLRLVR